MRVWSSLLSYVPRTTLCVVVCHTRTGSKPTAICSHMNCDLFSENQSTDSRVNRQGQGNHSTIDLIIRTEQSPRSRFLCASPPVHSVYLLTDKTLLGTYLRRSEWLHFTEIDNHTRQIHVKQIGSSCPQPNHLLRGLRDSMMIIMTTTTTTQEQTQLGQLYVCQPGGSYLPWTRGYRADSTRLESSYTLFHPRI